MHSRCPDKFDTGNALVDLLAQVRSRHEKSQTSRPRPALVRWGHPRFRCSQQERSLFDFAAGVGKHCSGGCELGYGRCPHPPRFLGEGVAGRALILLWCLPSLSMLGAQASFEWRKQRVLETDLAQAKALGRHFVVGYSSFPEVAVLAEKGLIAGVYITRHNVAGSPAHPKQEISALQDKRRVAGLPPLIVAADQEGGIVSHLAPPLTKLPALSTLANLAPEVRAEKAQAFGRIHGQELAALGVNMNLAPVLDLRPEPKRNRFDFNTLIGQRAISDDPAIVADIARAYVSGLEASGVGATVKHFPGLGRVRSDTIISARTSIRRPTNSRPPTGYRSGRCWPAPRRN